MSSEGYGVVQEAFKRERDQLRLRVGELEAENKRLREALEERSHQYELTLVTRNAAKSAYLEIDALLKRNRARFFISVMFSARKRLLDWRDDLSSAVAWADGKFEEWKKEWMKRHKIS